MQKLYVGRGYLQTKLP